MGIEKTSSVRKGKHSWESGKGRRKHKRLSPVQVLYNTCKEVFANCGHGIVPLSEKIERLKAVLDGITGADVGVTPNMQYFREQKTEGFPRIAYIQIYECDKFSIGLFCLPPSAVIPLHNHPEMTVFSKLLFGTMHIKSLDWVNDAPDKTVLNVKPPDANGVISAGARLAKVKVNTDFTAPCDTSILYPADGGNMHCLSALTPCAVLDVLGPPYSNTEGRDCTFYREYPFTRLSADGISVLEEEKEGYAWLQEMDIPAGSDLYRKLYSGPKIVTK